MKAVPTGIAFFFHINHPRAGQTKNTQNLDRHELITKKQLYEVTNKIATSFCFSTNLLHFFLPEYNNIMEFEIPYRNRGADMRTKNQETLDRILKFVNKYYQEHHSSPTINDVAEGVGVARSTTHRYLQELSDRNLIDYGRGILSAPQSAKMKTAYVSAPLVGSIRCGNPEDEEESIEEYVSLPVSMFGKGDFYILRAKGDSMVDAGIDEDDLLVIERNCPALEGDVVVALDEDNQNTLKRYAGYDKDSGYYILEYENEEQYPGKTIKVRSFQVQGVARHVIKSL